MGNQKNRAPGSPKLSERFSTVARPELQRSKFDRSFSHKTTINGAFLYPLFVDEVLPGDTMNLTPTFFARMATPLRPFMDGLHMDYQFFFCPLRLVWDNFVRMMGERPDPADHNDYTVPQMVAPASTGHDIGSLSDYLTLPTGVPDYTHSSLFHRVYALTFREWYRDENLVDPPIVDMDDGPDDEADYPLFRRGKRKDYFSGALPFAQKGDPVTFSLGISAPLVGVVPIVPTTAGIPSFDAGASSNLQIINTPSGAADLELSSSPSGSNDLEWNTTALESDLSVGGTADLAGATANSINDMRVAITVQHLLERDARGGTRYREQVLAHFGVHTDDIRLMRPELLATGSTSIQATAVAQTAVNDGFSTKLGDLGAFATAVQTGRGFMKSFTEHGIVMGIASIRAELTYQQGLHKMFRRKTRLEFYWPDLAGLGEQVVESGELYTDGTGDPDATPPTGDFEIFGYQPRYEEYRHRTSVITGDLRSASPESLDIWHLALDFATRPVLNEAFIEENPPIARVIQVPAAPDFIVDCFFKISHVRPMPKYGTPGLNRF